MGFSMKDMVESLTKDYISAIQERPYKWLVVTRKDLGKNLFSLRNKPIVLRNLDEFFYL